MTEQNGRHPNFYLWSIIQGMLDLHELPASERNCGWCDKEAVILLPKDHWDETSPLTQPACVHHGGLEALTASEDGTSPYLTEYLTELGHGL